MFEVLWTVITCDGIDCAIENALTKSGAILG
jgi:hypothetical protein